MTFKVYGYAFIDEIGESYEIMFETFDTEVEAQEWVDKHRCSIDFTIESSAW